MATKLIDIPGIGPVVLAKRSQSKHLRLSITEGGAVRVSMPRWVSFSAGVTFAAKHADWIRHEQAKQVFVTIENGQRIGKLHYVRFEQVLSGQSITNRVTATEVIVRMQRGETSTDAGVQERARQAAARALKREAERLLPPRLASIALRHGFTYSAVSTKSLKRRWGSCDTHKAIVFNLYLMELPWELIDYVLLHELVHTEHMDHSPAFWQRMRQCDARSDMFRKEIRKYKPVVNGME